MTNENLKCLMCYCMTQYTTLHTNILHDDVKISDKEGLEFRINKLSKCILCLNKTTIAKSAAKQKNKQCTFNNLL